MAKYFYLDGIRIEIDHDKPIEGLLGCALDPRTQSEIQETCDHVKVESLDLDDGGKLVWRCEYCGISFAPKEGTNG